MRFATDTLRAMLLAVLLVLPAAPGLAQGRTPLLMEGKSTLYERVLTAPRARFSDTPGGAPAGAELPAFSSFYVYDRREVGGTPWVELGSDRAGRLAGWMPESSTIPWRQQMALTFANPSGRERNPLFADSATLIDILESDDPAAAVAPLRQAALDGEASEKVVALEPATHVDFSRNFYLLPILSAEQAYTASGAPVRALEIASVTKLPDDAPPPPPATDRTLREFSAAVVFVIDTTISMGPYIDRTREAVRRISERLAESDVADRVRFGLVAYRSNVEAVPALEYTARLYADPNEVADAAAFLDKVRDLEPATASSSRFDEDAFAGVLTALDEIDLSTFGARYLVLITDAGALRGNDPLSATKLDAEQVQIELRERGAALYALHLKTPAGARNHASAEAQYRALAAHPLASNPLYYPIDAGSVEAFGTTVESLAGAISDMTSAAFRGDEVPGGASDEPATSVEAQIRRDAFEVGRAMQLAWLGRVQQTRIPDFFRAWIADRDFADPLRQTTEVRVFLSRNRISDLYDTLSGLVDELDRAQGEERMSSSEFFDSLRSVAAKMGRDPAELADPETARLGDLGLFDEYLGDLPYKSTLMTLDLNEWRARPTAEQEQLLDAVRRKMRLYRLFMEDADRWVTLSPDAPAAEAVYPVPIDALP